MSLNRLGRTDRNVGLNRLSPGTVSALQKFERIVHQLALGECSILQYRNEKRAMVRRLRRIEGSLPPDGRGRKRKESV